MHDVWFATASAHKFAEVLAPTQPGALSYIPTEARAMEAHSPTVVVVVVLAVVAFVGVVVVAVEFVAVVWFAAVEFFGV